MITERHEELAALHALALLEGAERSAFEAELAGDTELRAFTALLAGTGAALAFAAPQVEPPAGLKDRVLSAVDTPVPAAGAGPAVILFRFAPWAVAAGLALTATWFAAQNSTLRRENDGLRTERDLAEVAYKMTQSKLATRSLLAERMITDLGNRLRHSEDLSRFKITALASLAGNTREAQVIALWDPAQQSGLLTLDRLPPIADAQDYQIWIVDPAYKDPVNGGVFHVTVDGRVALTFKPDQPVTQAAAFAISLEKKGGVPKAEGPVVLLGKVPPL